MSYDIDVSESISLTATKDGRILIQVAWDYPSNDDGISYMDMATAAKLRDALTNLIENHPYPSTVSE